MDKHYKYTIIIPHFQIPKLLRRCLASIPKRTDTQVIVVDDCSGREFVNELKVLAIDFPYVEFVFSKENGGGGKARNIGLRHALGDYVLFADADDFFFYCISEIFDEYSCKDFDIAFFHANYLDTETYLPTRRGTTLKRVMRMYEKNQNIDLLRYLFGEPWCKLVKREIIERNNIRFDETPIHNDTKYSYLVGYYAKKAVVDTRALYCLADRMCSVSKQLTPDKRLIRVKVFAEKNRFLSEHGKRQFDTLMLEPCWYFAKKCDWTHLREIFQIAKEYGFKKSFIIKKTIQNKLKKKAGSIVHRLCLMRGEVN